MTFIDPIQKILFGSPGTGKSHHIQKIAIEQLKIELSSESNTLQNTIKTVFHPEYNYSDFLGKLLPQTQGSSIIYKFYPGHFLKILGMAYRSIINSNKPDSPPIQHYLLVIDELNRGNAAAIFGSIFQLLDRDDDHWSSYNIDISGLELMALFGVMGYERDLSADGTLRIQEEGGGDHGLLSFEEFFRRKNSFFSCKKKEYESYLDLDDEDYEDAVVASGAAARLSALLSEGKISIPLNLSILATINTSDESIYYLDSAFKRRWDWEYVESPNPQSLAPESLKKVILNLDDDGDYMYWTHCIVGINQLIINNARNIRRIEDKQIGWWFIKAKAGEISLQQIKGKLMFYLWDSVFVKDRRPLQQLLSDKLKDPNLELLSFSDFTYHTKTFVRSFEGSHQEAKLWKGKKYDYDDMPF
jgi:5-methylcytosine-specific restriction enzyme B